jgi:hypothetical protein
VDMFLGAVTIEPFEVSRCCGGCGSVYGIWRGMCWERRCFWGKGGEDRGAAISRGDEERCRGKLAGAVFAGFSSKTTIGWLCVGEHGDCGR